MSDRTRCDRECRCGCGTKVQNRARTGFAPGHFNRGRSRPDMLGNKWAWKRGWYMDHGYKVIYKPGHPLANKRGYVREHALIAEKVLGRPLRVFGKNDPRNEEVHHVNEDTTDNCHQNMVICTRSYHKMLHHRMRRPAKSAA